MKKFIGTVSLLLFISACSTSRLVDQYANPDHSDYRMNKVLVIGLAPEGGLQRQFEYSLVTSLQHSNIQAVKSVDIFGEPFSVSDYSEEQMEQLENELIVAGFDSVLFTKITGRESRVSLAQSYRNLMKTFSTFGEYYKENIDIMDDGALEDAPVINTQTSLYCLCPNGSNELIWQGEIDIVNSPGPQRSIRDHVKLVMRSLKKNRLLVAAP